MNDDPNEKPSSWPAERLVRFLVGMIVFGGLMGVRGEFHSVWVRALIAGIAGGTFAIVVLPFQKYGR